MATLQEQFLAIQTELEKPVKDVNKSQMTAKLIQLHADLQEDMEEIPLAIFESMNTEARHTALMGLVVMWMSVLQME